MSVVPQTSRLMLVELMMRTQTTTDRGDLEDLQWMNFQMEFYGILDGFLESLARDDCEVEIRWAVPVAAFNMAGEMWMESDYLG